MQARLGEMLGGIPRQHVSNMKRGIRPVSMKTARKLAKIFPGVSGEVCLIGQFRTSISDPALIGLRSSLRFNTVVTRAIFLRHTLSHATKLL